jgi:hypothetical protein
VHVTVSPSGSFHGGAWNARYDPDLAADVDHRPRAVELREVGAGRTDLFAEEAGIELGFAESQGKHVQARAEQIVRLCRLAGADDGLIPRWAEIGRERAERNGRPPFSQSVRRPP